MLDPNKRKRSYKELEARIKKLKSAEQELHQLSPPPEVFGAEIESIRAKLKSPLLSEEVEQELVALRQKVLEHQASSEGAAAPKGKNRKAVEAAAADVEGRGGTESVVTVDDSLSRTGTLPQLENYSIEKRIGRGGFADVYLGHNTEGVAVALKIPRFPQYETIEAKDFINEAELWSKLSKLKHPHIVELYEYGTAPYPWIAMEYVAGGSLRLKIGRLGCEDCLEIAPKLMEALHFAHHHGIVHRDIKPENVLFDDHGTPKLTDWGLARLLLDPPEGSLAFRGTVSYSAPEQLARARFGAVDWRTDIYQMGMLVYEMLTGQLPFGGLELGIAVASILNDPPPAPSRLNSQISRQLDDAVLQAIAKRKEDRFQTMDAFRDKLEEVSRSI